MRAVVMILSTGVLCASCGAGRPAHYRVSDALDCIRRADDLTFPHTPPGGIHAAFTSPDGVSAFERVAVAFTPTDVGIVANSLAPTRLGADKPTWTEKRGDAEVWGFGPYVPRIAKRQGISAHDAQRALAPLDRRVRSAVDSCLAQNER